jgi:hypothetical protein
MLTLLAVRAMSQPTPADQDPLLSSLLGALGLVLFVLPAGKLLWSRWLQGPRHHHHH